MKSVPINDAESIIQAFWDPKFSDLKSHEFWHGESTRANIGVKYFYKTRGLVYWLVVFSLWMA